MSGVTLKKTEGLTYLNSLVNKKSTMKNLFIVSVISVVLGALIIMIKLPNSETEEISSVGVVIFLIGLILAYIFKSLKKEYDDCFTNIVSKVLPGDFKKDDLRSFTIEYLSFNDSELKYSRDSYQLIKKVIINGQEYDNPKYIKEFEKGL